MTYSHSRRLLIALSAPLLLAPTCALHAQLRASEPALVSQTVDGTKMTVTYSRPRARGRTGIFGNTVKWGHTWTPGANQATTLAVTRDVTIEKVAVPKGRYSVWLVVNQGPWELLLDRDSTRFHTQPPRAGSGVISIPVKRDKREFTEVLTWSFPAVGETATTLVMQWDTVAVPLHIAVTPSYSRATTQEAAQRIVGRYQLQWEPLPPRPPGDSATEESNDWPTSTMLTVRYEGNELRAVMDPPMFRTEPGYTDWLLVPAKGDWYHPARFQDGQLAELMEYFGFRFDVANGKARGLEVRMMDDALLASGKRQEDKR